MPDGMLHPEIPSTALMLAQKQLIRILLWTRLLVLHLVLLVSVVWPSLLVCDHELACFLEIDSHPSSAILVGEARNWLPELVERARKLRVNGGFEPDADLWVYLWRHQIYSSDQIPSWEKTVDPLSLRTPKRESPIWLLPLRTKVVKFCLMEGIWLYRITLMAILWVLQLSRPELLWDATSQYPAIFLVQRRLTKDI